MTLKHKYSNSGRSYDELRHKAVTTNTIGTDYFIYFCFQAYYQDHQLDTWYWTSRTLQIIHAHFRLAFVCDTKSTPLQH